MDDEAVVHATRWCTRTRKFNATQQRFFKDFVLALKDVSLPPADLSHSKPLGKGAFGVIEESVCHAASLSLWLLLYLSVCLCSVVRSSPLSLSSKASKASSARNVTQATFWQVLAHAAFSMGTICARTIRPGRVYVCNNAGPHFAACISVVQGRSAWQPFPMYKHVCA